MELQAASPSAVTDQIPGCINASSVNNFDFRTTIVDPDGVYDRTRSGTNGIYGSLYFSLTLDNFDGGCTTCNSSNNTAYSPGDLVIVTFDFEYPVIITDLLIVDIDASYNANPPGGQGSFQDRVTLAAEGTDGTNAPLSLSVITPGRITLSGQTATADFVAGVNRNVSPTDGRGQVRVTSSSPVKSLSISYIAGPDDPNPAQQAIAISTFDLCCPRVVDISGRVFSDCETTFDGTVNGTGLGNPSGTTLYANIVEPVSNTVVGSIPVNSNGTYTVQDIPANDTYQVVISTTQGTFGLDQGAAPAAILPSGWNFVAENLGAGAGSDGTGNGILTNIVVGTSNVSNANFEINRPLVATTSSNQTVCEGDNVTLNGNATGGSGSYGYSWDNGLGAFQNQTFVPPNTGSPTNNTTTNYTLTVTDGFGCTATSTVNVTVNATPTVTVSKTDEICVGGNNGTITFSFVDHNSRTGIEFSINDNTPTYPITSSDNAGTRTVTGLSTVTYDLWVRWGNGECPVDLGNLTINSGVNPVASASSNSPICIGETINLSSTGGSSYSWSGPNSFTSNSQNPSIAGATLAMAGTYSVVVTDGSSCTASATTAIVVNSPPTVSITGTDNLTCDVTSVSRTATGGGTYSWSNSLGSNATANISSPGTYTVTITNTTTGCTTSATTVVTQNIITPTLTITNDTLGCLDKVGDVSLLVSGGTAPFDYNWDNDGTGDFDDNLNLIGIPSGIYNVTVRGANGCTSSAIGQVVFTACPSLTIVKTQIGGQNPVTTPGNIDYEVVVSNTGNTNLTGVTVSDTLPNGTVGTLVGPATDTGLTNVLDTNEVWTYTISYPVTQADIDNGAELVNTAVVTTDSLPTPQSDTAGTPVNQTPSLTIVKTQVGGQNPVTSPGTIDYEVVITNTGNTNLTGVMVSDTLPDGTVGVLVGPLADTGAIGELDTLESWVYTISFEVGLPELTNLDSLVNTAFVSTVELPIPKSDTAYTDIKKVDLEISKVVSNSNPSVGDTVTFTIEVSNLGPDEATNVQVHDYIQTGYSNLHNISNAGFLVIDTLKWTALNIPVGGSISLTFDVEVNVFGDNISYDNVAEVSFVDQFDIDSEEANFTGTVVEDDEAKICIAPDIIGLDQVCLGDSLVLIAGGGQTFTWLTPSGTYNSDNIVIPNSNFSDAGTYMVEITNSNGCVITKTISVQVDSMPNVMVEALPSGCNGDASRNDGRIKLFDFDASQTYQVNEGSSFNMNIATPRGTIPNDGEILTGLHNPINSVFYTVRVYNSNDCFTDYTVELVNITCACPAEKIIIPFRINKTKSN